MCASRQWTGLIAYGERGKIIFGATRSDGVMFRIKVENELPLIIQAIKDLESRRTCKCTNTEVCKIHKEQ